MAKKTSKINPAPVAMEVVSEGRFIEIKEHKEAVKGKGYSTKPSRIVTPSMVSAPPAPTNGIEVTSVTTGPTTLTLAGHSAIKASLSKIQLAILTALYKLDAPVTAAELHSLDSTISVPQAKHHCYKDERLATLGLVEIVRTKGERTLSYRVTGAGMAVVRAR